MKEFEYPRRKAPITMLKILLSLDCAQYVKRLRPKVVCAAQQLFWEHGQSNSETFFNVCFPKSVTGRYSSGLGYQAGEVTSRFRDTS